MKINEQCTQYIEASVNERTHSKKQEERDCERCFILKRPAIAQSHDLAGEDERNGDLDPCLFDREVCHILAPFLVQCYSFLFGYSSIIPILKLAIDERRNSTSNSIRDEGKPYIIEYRNVLIRDGAYRFVDR